LTSVEGIREETRLTKDAVSAVGVRFGTRTAQVALTGTSNGTNLVHGTTLAVTHIGREETRLADLTTGSIRQGLITTRTDVALVAEALAVNSPGGQR